MCKIYGEPNITTKFKQTKKYLSAVQWLPKKDAFFSNVSLILSNLQPNHCIFWRNDIEMKKKIRPRHGNGNRIGNQGDANVIAPKCNICYKTVRTNSKWLMCEHCKLLVHLNCATVNLKIENSKIARLWSCQACTLENYPYTTKMCYLWTKKRWHLTTTLIYTCHKTSRTQNTHQYMPS